MSTIAPSSAAAAFRDGARESFGVPSAVLGAGYLGFGALAAGHDFSLFAALLSTAAIWALPGQVVLVEMHAASAPLVAIVVTVMLTSARFLPMTVALMPLLRAPRHSRTAFYLAAHLVAMTGWAAAMRRCPELPPDARLAYFTGFALTNWGTSFLCTAIGYLLADALPPLVKLGFVFLSPVYFLLILTGDARTRATVLALVCGALAGPAAHLVVPGWSVLAGGVAGGTLAYLALRTGGRRG